MELEAENWRLCSATLVRGASGELEDENWRSCSATLVRGVSGELEGENWRLCSATVVRGATWNLPSLSWLHDLTQLWKHAVQSSITLDNKAFQEN